MVIKIKRIIYHLLKYGLFGMMGGSLIYFILIIFTNDYGTMSKVFAISYLCICFLIGLFTEIFNLDKIPFIIQYLIHFVLTGISVWIFNILIHNFSIDNFQSNISFLIQFILIYVLVWVGIYFVNYDQTQKINSAIIKRKQSK